MGKGSVKKATPKKQATKGKSIVIKKTPKKADSKFTKEVSVFADQKDYFKLD